MNAHAPVVSPPLVDPFGRAITYVRVSVTDRCDFRCLYCMSEDMNFLPKRDVLSLEELDRLCSAFVRLGTRKLRVTGGEPLVRRGIMTLFRSLSRHLTSGALDDLTLTTNGSQLARFAAELADCGVKRVNVSMDTLDPVKFRAVTRWGELGTVMAGLDAADKAGMKVKINAVALKGFNDVEAISLIEWAHDRGYDLTFIEVMPLDGQALWDRSQVFTMDEILAVLRRDVGPLEAMPEADPRAPGLRFRYLDGRGTAGFIASVSRPFCLNCNRVRLTADGKLRYCLFAIEETDVQALLRSGASDGQIAEAIRETVRKKWLGHEINTARFVAPPRAMYAIGG